MNIIDLCKQVLLQSGASWILWLLGLLSLLSVTIIIERWFFYRARGSDLGALAHDLERYLLGSKSSKAPPDFAKAEKALAQSPAVAATIAVAGLRLAAEGYGSGAVQKAMESAAALEKNRLEKWLSYLGTVGTNAPFIGLFGTVIGVIGAFEELQHTVPGHAGAGASALKEVAATAAANSQFASQAVMGSIAEALVATAIGILVAIPAVAAYNYFQRRLVILLSGTEVLSNLVLAYILENERETERRATWR